MAIKKKTEKDFAKKPATKRGSKPRRDENGEERKCFICGATKNLVRPLSCSAS